MGTDSVYGLGGKVVHGCIVRASWKVHSWGHSQGRNKKYMGVCYGRDGRCMIVQLRQGLTRYRG